MTTNEAQGRELSRILTHEANKKTVLEFYEKELKQRFPGLHGEIKRVFADRDYVILHVHARREPGDAGIAIVDIFRLEAGQIVEHWDVRQPIPATSVNNNGVF